MAQSSFDLSGSDQQWKTMAAATFSQPVPTTRGATPHRIAKWKGEPGTYDRPNGMPWSEVFVVYSGSGRIRFADGEVVLCAGTVIDLQKGVPYVLEIEQTLEKFAVISE
jgi:uncharacterized cupin superfamily protein